VLQQNLLQTAFGHMVDLLLISPAADFTVLTHLFRHHLFRRIAQGDDQHDL
jgi:hypothetical protein